MAGSKSVSSEIVLELIRLISQPIFKRTEHEIELVLPWLRKRSQLLQNQEQNVLADIVKNCTFISCSHDDVILKQGDRGDCFYIILRGSVSVYIDPKMTGESPDESQGRPSAKKKKVKKPPKAPESEDSVLSGMEKPLSEDQEGELPILEEDEEEDEDGAAKKPKRSTKALAPLDRSKFGKFIVDYSTGKAFGELALVHRESLRNASVIADEETDLMVIDQDLFDRSLRAEQEAKYTEIRNFIEDHPFFNQMTVKFKKLLEMSVRKEHYIFDTNIIRQGDPVQGLHFLISGSANVTIQPKKHQTQYMHLWPFEAGMDQLSIEFEHLREMRRQAILRKYEDPSVWETKPEELVIRREQGYAAIEKKMKENHINLCSVQAREVLGDVETLVGLSTYIQTVRCTSNTTCFVLDTKNFERLVGKKSNPQTMEVMREYVKAKLHTRMNMRNADLIPLLGYLHQKLTEQLLPPTKKVEPFKNSKAPPDVEEEMQHLLQYFREGKEVVLIKPSIPGVVYYREIMRDKAKQRESQRKASKPGDSIKLGSVYKNRARRQPRSMLQIRESLRQMMEAEVIEMESTKIKKKRKPKPKPQKDQSDPPSTFRNAIDVTPRTQMGSQKDISQMPNESKSARNSKPSLMASLRASEAQKKETESMQNGQDIGDLTNDAMKNLKVNQNLPKATPPVFVTEVSKPQLAESGLTLPAIKEENSQDEIILNSNSKSKPLLDKRQKQNPNNFHNNDATDKTNDTSLNGNKGENVKKGKGGSHLHGKKTPVLPKIITSDTSQYHDSQSTLLNGDNLENFVKLPAIGGSVKDTQGNSDVNNTSEPALTSRTEDSTSTLSSKWQTAVKFVNKKVQDRLAHSIMEEETSYKDFETSEPSMKLLENRIKAFHIKYGMGSKTKNLPHLKRYKLDDTGEPDDKRLPRPGGKVWVKRHTCRFADTEYVVKDHKHVRYQMVESIPEFDRVQKSKVVVQQILKTADYGENDMF